MLNTEAALTCKEDLKDRCQTRLKVIEDGIGLVLGTILFLPKYWMLPKSLGLSSPMYSIVKDRL